METWKEIPGFEGFYEVSDQGRVRSLDCIRKRVSRQGVVTDIRHQGRILLPGLDTAGYMMVNLHRDDGTRKVGLVHRLVLSAFDRLPRSGEEVRHLDGVRTNNVLANLAWGTWLENLEDKRRHGTIRAPRGEEHGRAKLTANDVLYIRNMVGRRTQASLARDFGVSQPCVEKVAARKTWAWLP